MNLINVLFHKKTLKLGLSLRGGGARTYLYLGLFKFLEEYNVAPSVLIGSSGGALLASAYGAGKKSDEFVDYSKNFKKVNYTSFNAILKMDYWDKHKIQKWGKDFIGDLQLENLPIKTYIQVTNFSYGIGEIMDRGSVDFWAAASSALPFLMEPYDFEGSIYGDGDITAVYESNFLKKNGANIVIGCRLATEPDTDESNSAMDRIRNLILPSKNKILELDQRLDPVDVEIQFPVPKDLGLLDFHKAELAMNVGYEYIKTSGVGDKLKHLLKLK